MRKKPFRFYRGIILCRLAALKTRIEKSGGSSYPGLAALNTCDDFLTYAAEGVRTVLVIGTNGKTTVTRMVSHILTCCGVANFSNRSGANMLTGIATAFGMNRSLSGTARARVAVIECDELCVEKVLSRLKPAVIILTDISDDQIYRLKGAENVTKVFSNALSCLEDAPCCIDRTGLYTTQIISRLQCPVIDYARTGTDTVCVGSESCRMEWKIRGAYNVQNAAAACAGVSAFGIGIRKACTALGSFQLPFGRMERFFVGNVETTLTLIKNAVGANAVIDTLRETKQNGILFFAVNDRQADDVDLRWLSSVDYETLKSLFSPIYLLGSVAGLVHKTYLPEGILLQENCVDAIRGMEAPVHILANYTAMMEIRSKLAKKGYVSDFWKD